MDHSGRTALTLLEALISRLEAEGVLTPEGVAEIYDASVARALKAEMSSPQAVDPAPIIRLAHARLN
jgi:hypothetical protein